MSECMDDAQIRIELARLDERQKALDRQIIRSEAANDKALGIATNELARRLDILNHSHTEAQRVLGTYLPREIYDRAHKELEVRIDGLYKELVGRVDALERHNANLAGKMWIGGATVLVVAGVLATLIQVLK